MEFEKSKGFTPSEKVLAEAAEKTFLKLWSYPNVFRDQGRSSGTGDGKEIADLLVIFGENLIIFSDKSCYLSETDDIDLAWSRWYKRTIKKSAQQILGAERWLMRHPENIFLDKQCQCRLPIPLPSSNTWKVYRIVVATGARKRCLKEYGGSGSLSIRPSLIGDQHTLDHSRKEKSAQSSNYKPLSIGWIDPTRFIHVLDEVTLQILLGELDTITDFVDYLNEKESLIRSGKLQFAAGEEELLWEYLREGNNKEYCHFSIDSNHRAEILSISSGKWKAWQAKSEYKFMKIANKRSCEFWDYLIDKVTDEVLADRITLSGNATSMSDIEICLRNMASEPRITRRAIYKAFLDRKTDAESIGTCYRMFFSTVKPDIGYVFLFFQRQDNETFEEYRRKRMMLLMGLFMLYWKYNSHLKQIIGFAIQVNFSGFSDFEIGHFVPSDEFDIDQYPEEINQLKTALGLRDDAINAKGFLEIDIAASAG